MITFFFFSIADEEDPDDLSKMDIASLEQLKSKQ